MSPQPHLYLSSLTGLRFVAAVHVVLYHFAGILLPAIPPWARHVIEAGHLGVSLFFVLSGFVLAYTYLDGRPVEKRRFWIARVARIYPLYAASFLVAAPFYAAYRLERETVPVAFAHLAAFTVLWATMTQAWTPFARTLWNDPSWTLSVEAAFYAFFPLVGVLLLRVHQRGERWLLAVLLCAWVANLAHPASESLGGGRLPEWWRMLVYSNPLGRLPEFIIGMVLGRGFVVGHRLRHSSWAALFSAAAVFALYTSGSAPLPWVHRGLLVPLFALLVYALAHGRGVIARLLSLPLLVLLGNASYALYILQRPVADIVQAIQIGTIRVLPENPPGYFLSEVWFVAYLVGLIGVSILSLRFLESPARTFLTEALSGYGRSFPTAPSWRTARAGRSLV